MLLSDTRFPQCSGPQQNALTNRELQVLSLVAQGLTDNGIAHGPGISKHTVAFHLRNLRRKLNATSRVEAVTRARLAGYDV